MIGKKICILYIMSDNSSTVSNILIGLLIIGLGIAIGVFTKMIWISVVIISVYLIYMLLRHAYVSSGPSDGNLPTTSYMKYVAGNCPDYWTIDKLTKDKVICKNKYNLMVNNTKNCYDKDSKNLKTFNRIKKWPPRKAEKNERCDWSRKCGPSTKIFASWIGMNC